MRKINQTANSIETEVERALTNDSSHPGYLARAFRYPIQTLIHFRKSGAADWRVGKIVNISRTGVLFQSDKGLTPRTLLEMKIALPHEVQTEPPASVLCWGPVIRLDAKNAKRGPIALAAAISRYRFGSD